MIAGKNNAMKKIILINGVIAGLIISGIMVLTHPLVDDGTIDMDNGMFLGYTSMVLGFAMIFVAIKSYRDGVLNGVITFLQGCKIGLLVVLIASLMYAITWDIYYRVAASDFCEKYETHYLKKMEQEGASEEEITSMRADMDNFNRLYENAFIRFGLTLMEILPIGIIITLISAGILKRKEVLPVTKYSDSK